jgi:acyl dehydratase
MSWHEGQPLKELKFPPITRAQLSAYADASLDRNPIHLDESFAQAAGFPTVIVHGMLQMAFMADHLRMNFPESQFRVAKLKSRFRKVTLAGDELTCGGAIKKQDPSGHLIVTLWSKNQKGETTADSEAELVQK